MREKHIKMCILKSMRELWVSHSWLSSIVIPFSFELRVRMKLSKAQKLLVVQSSSQSIKMIIKLSTLVLLLMCCYTSVSTFFKVGKVAIPDGCARACPPQRDPSRNICARNIATGRLGMFDGECHFGRFNHCVHVRSRKSIFW